MTVVALRTKDITPEMVLRNVIEDNPAHVYVVAFDAEGVPGVWASGDLSRMSDAALILNARATAHAMGEVESE